MAALPAVLASLKLVTPPLLAIAALPAVLVLLKFVIPLLLLAMVA